MPPPAWSREEVEATVSDYFEMLRADIAGVPYNKTRHRQLLRKQLDGRTESAIEFKHQNISAVLIELGCQYIPGYKAATNYQAMLVDVVAEHLAKDEKLRALAAADAERPIVIPEVDHILKILRKPPASRDKAPAAVSQRPPARVPFKVDFLEREARNRDLGQAGEEMALNYERARLIHLGCEALAGKVEHTSKVRGDGAGYDILSFEKTGAERLIEVKTTKYGDRTPFFVSRNELAVSEERQAAYHLYRLYSFRSVPELFILDGALSSTCQLDAASYLATVK